MNLSQQLDKRITIQRRGAGKDALNQPLPTSWAEVGKVWASILHLNGIEAVKAGADASIVRASIRIRYRADIDEGMRIVHKSTVYEILSVLPDLVGKRHVDLACKVVK